MENDSESLFLKKAIQNKIYKVISNKILDSKGFAVKFRAMVWGFRHFLKH